MTTDTPPRGVPLPPPEQLDRSHEATGTPARPTPNGRPPARRRTAFTRPDESERDWRSRGACASGEHDAELWFSSLPAERHRAMMLCYGCPVLTTCRSWAEDTRQGFGVWGGLDFEVSPEQRIDPGTGAPGKPAAARVPLLERVAAVELSHPGASLAFIAETLGYKSAASLERTLYRRGAEGKATIRRLKPGSRNKETITAISAASDQLHPWHTEPALPVRPDGRNAQHEPRLALPAPADTSTGTEHAA